MCSVYLNDGIRGVTLCRFTVNNVTEEYAVHIFISATLTILAADTPLTSGKIYQTTRSRVKEDFNIHGSEVSVLSLNSLFETRLLFGIICCIHFEKHVRRLRNGLRLPNYRSSLICDFVEQQRRILTEKKTGNALGRVRVIIDAVEKQ